MTNQLPNRYSVAPLGGLDVGTKMTNIIEGGRKQNRLTKMREKSQAVFKTGDPTRIANFMVEYPEMATTIEKATGVQEEGQKREIVDVAKGLLTPGADPKEVIAKYATALKDSGRDPKMAVSMLSKVMADPAQAEQMGMKLLAIHSPDDFLTFRKATGAGTSTSTSTQKEYAQAVQQGFKGSLMDYKQQLSGKGSGGEFEGLSTGYEEYLRVYEKPKSPESYKDYQDVQAKNKKELAKAGKERPYVSQLMADGWLPSGRITGPQLEAFEAAAQKAAEQGKPLTPQDLRDMEFRAQKNKSTGATAGGRLSLARKQNIVSARGLLVDMRVAAKKLKFSEIKFVAALDKYKKGQLQDPLFTEYMVQRADALFVLGTALKQNGLTDKSIEVEEEAFNATLSPKAFDAWYNTQMRALNRAADEMNTDFKYGIEQDTQTVPAGQGGAGLPATPEAEITQEDFDALESGSVYYDGGKQYRKP